MAEFLSDYIFYLVPLMLLFPFVMMKGTDWLHARYRVGNMAQRMGLTIAEGDPKLNLVNAIPAHDFKWGTGVGSSWLSRLANTTTETKVHLVGAPRGRPTEFVYHRREDTKDRVLVITTGSWFECRLSVQALSPSPSSRSCGAVRIWASTDRRPCPSCRCRRSRSANRLSTASSP